MQTDVLANFEVHLTANPEDADARLVFADFLEEQGRHRQADLQRRVARREVWPFKFKGFGWYDVSRRRPGDNYPESNLPVSVFQSLVGHESVNSSFSWKWYSTLAAALDALAAAWGGGGMT